MTEVPAPKLAADAPRLSRGILPTVGEEMARDAEYFRLGCRICTELAAQSVKTDYVAGGFRTVVASCPVPIAMAGGKKIPEFDASAMAYDAIRQGAAGVDMGRNIFQSEASPGHDEGGWEDRPREQEAQERIRFFQDPQGSAEAGWEKCP